MLPRRLLLLGGSLVDWCGRRLGDVLNDWRLFRLGKRWRLLQVGNRRLTANALVLRDIRLLHELSRRLSQRIRRLLVAWPFRLTERLVLELLQLGIAGAVLALQLQMLSNGLVKDAHG